MAMRINQNIAATNAYRNLGVTEGQLSKSLERLSSGFRINRAADDAAGLAISEKLRGQVSGLNVASANAQNSISLIQTAEGALNESHAILQRMRDLSVQSSNDTNTVEDRAQIQKEVTELAKELTRISSATEFNTKKLLDGSFNGKFQIGANEGQNLSLSIGDMSASALGAVGGAKIATTATASAAVANGTYTVTSNGDANNFALRDSSGNVFATSTNGGDIYTTASGATINFGGAVNTPVRSGTVTVTGGTAVTATATVDKAGAGTAKLDVGSYEFRTVGAGVQVFNSATNAQVGSFTAGTLTLTDAAGGTSTYVFDAAAATNGVKFKVDGADVSTQASANATISVLDRAIASVSDQRSGLGAVQNRLDHTISNLGVAAENLSASESRIRDADMAAEMMKFTRNQILSQAGTSMLAQANQLPQGVLGLLR